MKKYPPRKNLLIISLLSAFILPNLLLATPAKAQTSVIRPIIFPVIGSVTYYDDFGAPRSGGRSHEGNDLMGKKMLPLVSTVNGIITNVEYPEASWGYAVTIRDSEGYTYHYLHINNDTPGTDNGQGGGMNAYGVDIKEGNPVVAGQLIGWMGDSGNAETTTAHLHFEIRLNGQPFSPYQSLKAATKISTPAGYPALPDEILPFGNFQGGGNIAAGNLDADTAPELVVGAGPTGGPHIQIFDDGATTAKFGFFPYAQTFRGGVDVAAGDIDGDGIDEIITAPGRGMGPEVKVFKTDGTRILSFMAYTSGFAGGVRVAAADVTGDGVAEIITAPASGGGAHVKIFNASGTLIKEFIAYDGFTGGIDVAAFKAVGSNPALIATSPNTGGGPHVKVFDAGSGAFRSEFMAYDPNHRGGMRVNIGQAQGSVTPQVVTAPLLGGPDIRMFDLTGNKLDSDSEFEVWWAGSWDVASALGKVYTSTGPNTKRRTSVRAVDFQSESSRRR